MKSWICNVCGYVHEGPEPPAECPQCGAPSDAFEAEEDDQEPPSAGLARWLCTVCGYVHEGEAPPDECPQCGASADLFEREAPASPKEDAAPSLDAYLAEWKRDEDAFEQKYASIVQAAVSGESAMAPMRTQRAFPDWDTILFRGAQLHRMPLNEDEPVGTRTVIGPTAKHPLELTIPYYVSHMSFGALSKEAKIALARGSRIIGTAMCSGEGGLLAEERQEASIYIYELGTASFSHRDDAIKQADAVEIKIGQAAKPGLGGHVPKEKVTEEIARVRGIPPHTDSISPGRHVGLDTREDLIRRVAGLKELTGGKPVGIKIAAGHVEGDLEFALAAQPDFITIDCRGGGTGNAPLFLKDNACLPPIFALHRARKYLDAVGSKATLCITGGFRDSADIAKALAMGADAVALATASLIAIGCQQYRVCNTGKCPVGITTQDPALRKRFNIDASTQRFINFYETTKRELMDLARISGRDDVHKLDKSDIFTVSNEVSMNTDIEHA